MKTTETNELTKRELIAAMALRELLANLDGWRDPYFRDLAVVASVKLADAFIAALNEGENE